LPANPLKSVYLFGGDDGETYFNDLWKYEGDNWSEINVSGAKPVSRTLTALAYDPPNQRLLLFGGRTVTGTVLADLWAFDLGSSTWTSLNEGGGGGDPPARMAHTLSYDPGTGKAVLVGGVAANGETLLADTWLYQAGWSQANPATPLPAHAYHQAVYAGDGLILVSNGEGWKYE
jgi:Galactose oxidase, central domain